VSWIRSLRAIVIFSGMALAVVSAGVAPAATRKIVSTVNEATWIHFDAAASTVTVKITSRGKGPKRKLVKKGREVTFNVLASGSVLKRTSVAINGARGEFTDIKPGKHVLIYWVPDPNKDGELFARKIDVIFSDAEARARHSL